MIYSSKNKRWLVGYCFGGWHYQLRNLPIWANIFVFWRKWIVYVFIEVQRWTVFLSMGKQHVSTKRSILSEEQTYDTFLLISKPRLSQNNLYIRLQMLEKDKTNNNNSYNNHQQQQQPIKRTRHNYTTLENKL